MKFIIGKKIGMTQTFAEDGRVIPVTLIKAGPCKVTQVKTEKKDGYDAVQLGFDPIDKKKAKKSQKGKEYRFLKEFKVKNGYKVGDEVSVSSFEPEDKVKVSGNSKGKGFQGVVKRWGFAGQPATHGTKHDERRGGSIGSAYPQRVFKGRKMPGRMGHDRVSVKNLDVVKVDSEDNVIALRGAVPGRKETILEIRSL